MTMPASVILEMLLLHYSARVKMPLVDRCTTKICAVHHVRLAVMVLEHGRSATLSMHNCDIVIRLRMNHN